MPYAFKVPDTDEVFEVNILSVNADKVSKRGQVVFTLEGEEVQREEQRTTRYLLNGKDVTERKPEFKTAEKMPDDSLREMSTARSDSIVVNAIKPYNILDKCMIPKSSSNFWILKASEKGPKAIVENRKRKMYELAEKWIRDGVAGLGSFSWGNVAGRATFAFHTVVYPIMLENGVVWVMRGAVNVLNKILEDPEFESLAKAIIPEPRQMELAVATKEQKKLAPETIEVPLI